MKYFSLLALALLLPFQITFGADEENQKNCPELPTTKLECSVDKIFVVILNADQCKEQQCLTPEEMVIVGSSMLELPEKFEEEDFPLAHEKIETSSTMLQAFNNHLSDKRDNITKLKQTAEKIKSDPEAYHAELQKLLGRLDIVESQITILETTISNQQKDIDRKISELEILINQQPADKRSLYQPLLDAYKGRGTISFLRHSFNFKNLQAQATDTDTTDPEKELKKINETIAAKESVITENENKIKELNRTAKEHRDYIQATNDAEAYVTYKKTHLSGITTGKINEAIDKELEKLEKIEKPSSDDTKKVAELKAFRELEIKRQKEAAYAAERKENGDNTVKTPFNDLSKEKPADILTVKKEREAASEAFQNDPQVKANRAKYNQEIETATEAKKEASRKRLGAQAAVDTKRAEEGNPIQDFDKYPEGSAAQAKKDEAQAARDAGNTAQADRLEAEAKNLRTPTERRLDDIKNPNIPTEKKEALKAEAQKLRTQELHENAAANLRKQAESESDPDKKRDLEIKSLESSQKALEANVPPEGTKEHDEYTENSATVKAQKNLLEKSQEVDGVNKKILEKAQEIDNLKKAKSDAQDKLTQAQQEREKLKEDIVNNPHLSEEEKEKRLEKLKEPSDAETKAEEEVAAKQKEITEEEEALKKQEAEKKKLEKEQQKARETASEQPCSYKDATGNNIYSTGYCVELETSIGKTKSISGQTGLDLLRSYIGVLYKYFASIVAIIAVLVIVVSGIQMSMAGFNSEFSSQAKTRIFQALASLILLLLIGLILRTINPIFFK